MNTKKEFVTDFTTGNAAKQLLIFSTPLLLSNLLQVVYNMVDMIIVGKAMGKIGLSAVAVGGDVSNLMTFLAMGFSNAGQVLIAQYIGAGQREKVGRFIGTMFHFLFCCAVVLSTVCLLLRKPILRLMNTPDSSWEQALAYSTVCMVGLVFIYGYNMVSAVLRGMGDSRHPFVFISIAAVMNVVLDLAFVFGFGMGAMGAALATVMSQGFSFLCCAVFLWKRREILGFTIAVRDFIHMEKEMLGKLVRLGVPMAIKSASIQTSKLFVNSWINSYGVEVSAVAGIANKFISISNLISNSINAAGSSMVGQNIGAKQYDRVWQIIKNVFAMTFTISTVMTVVMLMFPEQVFGIFTEEAEVLLVAMEFLPIAVINFYGSAFRAPANSLINGSGHYKVNFATAILDGIVMRIGLAMTLGLALHMRYVGFWLGDALAGFTPFVIGVVFYISGKWRRDV